MRKVSTTKCCKVPDLSSWRYIFLHSDLSRWAIEVSRAATMRVVHQPNTYPQLRSKKTFHRRMWATTIPVGDNLSIVILGASKNKSRLHLHFWLNPYLHCILLNTLRRHGINNISTQFITYNIKPNDTYFSQIFAGSGLILISTCMQETCNRRNTRADIRRSCFCELLLHKITP